VRPIGNLKSKNRLQFTETTDGRKYFKEYWIREWDGKDYNLSEHMPVRNLLSNVLAVTLAVSRLLMPGMRAGNLRSSFSISLARRFISSSP
ncbi:hypothetical protein, partial [Dehalococcoides sp.]